MYGLDPVADEGRARACRVALIRHYTRIAIVPFPRSVFHAKVIAMVLVLDIVPMLTVHIKWRV